MAAKILIFLIVFFSCSLLPGQIFIVPVQAVDSNSVISKVGNPTDPEPTISSGNAIVATAAQIAARLKSGGKGLTVDGIYHQWYSYDPTEPDTFYWCDYMVIDSWAAAGVNIQRPPKANGKDVGLGYVGWLAQLHQPGFQFLPGNSPVSEVQPGDMVLMTESGGGYHVAIVGSISVVNGNGEIQTYDSNSWDVTDNIDVVNGSPADHTNNIGNSHISGFGVPSQ